MQDSPSANRSSLVPGDIARNALIAFGVIAAGVTVIAVIESYTNLYEFARAYGLAGWRAAIAPGAVDSFIVLGELLLFAAVLLAWPKLPHILGAAMAGWGFILSTGGNVWHAAAATPADRAVSAIWPVTATAGLAGALLIVRLTMTGSRSQTPPSPVPHPHAEPRRAAPPREASRPGGPAAAADKAILARLAAAGGPLPGQRELARTEGIPRPRARQILIAAGASMNGNAHGSAGQH